MTNTCQPGALEAARVQGFIEATFVWTDLDATDAAETPGARTLMRWGDECSANGHHSVIVGEIHGAFFTMVVLREGDPDAGYVLQNMRDAFVTYLGEEPVVTTDVPNEEAWHGPVTTRGQACALARALVAIDRRARDPDLELAFGIMAS